MKIYLAGPMSGYPDDNFLLFNRAAAELRSHGYEVFNPAEKGEEKERNDDLSFRRRVFNLDTHYITNEADAMVMLPAWERSRGAFAEKALADALGIPVYYYGQWDMGRAQATFKEWFPNAAKVTAPVTMLHPKKPIPEDAAERKTVPMCTGLLDYFPDALAAVAHVSYVGNQQHNPGEPLHWARGKSTDEADTAIRHIVQRGTSDVDGVRHLAKAAWRTLAMLQKELEEVYKLPLPRGCKAA